MIPYLLLTPKVRSEVNTLLNEHTVDEESRLSARSVLEEFGNDFDGIQRVFDVMEEKGQLAPGLYKALIFAMAGKPRPESDWRAVMRAVSGF